MGSGSGRIGRFKLGDCCRSLFESGDDLAYRRGSEDGKKNDLQHIQQVIFAELADELRKGIENKRETDGSPLGLGLLN